MRDGRGSPATGSIVAVVTVGGLAVVVGSFTPVGRVVVAIGVGFLLLVAGIGFAVDRHIARKFPPVTFDREERAAATELIESAGSRLAAGDSAAFALRPTVDGTGDAEGQIWLFAAEDGVVGRVAIELATPDWYDASGPERESVPLLLEGWEVESSRPGEWLVLTRSQGMEADALVILVVDSLVTLFDLPPESTWSCRASA